jgi:hypothetical protein
VVSGIDEDLAINNSMQMYYNHQFFPKDINDLTQRYINKRQFSTVELAPEYKTHENYVQNTLNDYILMQKKSIIKTLHDASIGHGKEPYQSALKSAYERLDGYKTLLKSYASIAGMAQSDNHASFPALLTNLPDSKSIQGTLSHYLDTATIDTAWPVDALLTSLSAAKRAVIRSVNCEAERFQNEQEEKHEIGSLQFVCPLQVEIFMNYYQLLELSLAKREEAPPNGLSEQDEPFIRHIYNACLEHFTLQKEWIIDVEVTWRCYQYLQGNLEAIRPLLREDCVDTREMGQNLSEIITRLLAIHNLLATYYRKQGYVLDISFTKGVSEKMNEIHSRLQEIDPAPGVTEDESVTLHSSHMAIPKTKEHDGEISDTEQELATTDSSRVSMKFFTNVGATTVPTKQTLEFK